jgi:hypothetical protein
MTKNFPQKQNTLRDDIENAINSHSAENSSDTPDFILAQYLVRCLEAFDQAIRQRDIWYGNSQRPSKTT